MDYKNQIGLFNPKKHEDATVSIVGVGAIGSITGIVLAKMGINTIIVFDDDKIEEHNLPNQFYLKGQMGMLKTEAFKGLVHCLSNTKVVEQGKLEKDTFLVSEIVIACTDTMRSRKLTYERAKLFCNFLIDARMSGNTYRIYTVNLKDKNHCKEYEKTLYSDKNSDKGVCTEKTIIYNVAEVAGKIGNQIKKVLNREEYNNLLMYDFVNDYLIKNKWRK